MTAAPIAEQSAALTEGMAGQVPADALEAFRAEQAGLDGVGVPDAVLGAGSVMPDARLLDVRGETVTLKQAAAAGPRSWCSTAVHGARTATSPCVRTSANSRRSWTSGASR